MREVLTSPANLIASWMLAQADPRSISRTSMESIGRFTPHEPGAAQRENHAMDMSCADQSMPRRRALTATTALVTGMFLPSAGASPTAAAPITRSRPAQPPRSTRTR